MRNLPRGIFLLGGENLTRSYFDPSYYFSKIKTIFCKYWTLTKIKSSMTWVYKEYEGMIKMVQEQWPQLKWSFYWVIVWKFLFSLEERTFGGGGGGDKNCWEGSLLGKTFPGAGGMSRSLTSGWGTPPIPPVEKTLLPSLKKVSKILNPPFG